ncbi:MAG: hypothetical protein P4L73_13320 [Caulobacteraceae bacterium]|nr:hypothetical protein [Caulobacteraceae bacterium]
MADRGPNGRFVCTPPRVREPDPVEIAPIGAEGPSSLQLAAVAGAAIVLVLAILLIARLLP